MTEKTAKPKDDELEVEVEGDDFEIEIEDDTPPQDRGKPKAAEKADDAGDDDGADDEDLEGYSEKVKKRINKLRYETHAERRAKEEAVRLREEAIKFAELQRKEAEALRKQLSEGQTAVVGQAKARVESQLLQAKTAFKNAYEAGDADAMLEAQTKLTELQNEAYRLANYRPPAPAAADPSPQTSAPQAQAQPQVSKPPKRAMEWAEANPWFGTDKEMTGYAYGVHESLVEQGVDPNSETYYTQIDAAVKKRFADKLGLSDQQVKTQTRPAGSVVASASRTSKTPRKVVITASAAALAKRLGLTPQQYAAQLMKENQNG